uniref:Putative LOC100572414 [Acyrthosiphon pisum] n=1 Tax=Lepeophtheirus salmonis TaxID=72036 RepID=A0A0K2VAK3_LEPSM
MRPISGHLYNFFFGTT